MHGPKNMLLYVLLFSFQIDFRHIVCTFLLVRAHLAPLIGFVLIQPINAPAQAHEELSTALNLLCLGSFQAQPQAVPTTFYSIEVW